MRNYINLLQDVLDNGQLESNRTGVDALTLPGAMLKFDLRHGFPAVTTKKLAFNQVKGELIGFLRGYTSAADFRALGCTIWDQNANENAAWLANPYRVDVDDLGRIYGSQWTSWDNGAGGAINQIERALRAVRTNPSDRGIVVSAWNVAELDAMALRPCHHYFQLLPRSDGTLHMTMGLRSSDLFLGLPFNIASYALLLELFAAWSGRRAATLTMFLADAHIYVNHIDQVKEQLGRAPLQLPKLKLNLHPALEAMPLEYLLSTLAPSNVQLEDYQHHPAISAPMAV